jgi:hypothetical protein
MYFSALVMWLAVAPALGSCVALPFFALLAPVIVWRLLNEEKVLRRELPGYDAYCQKAQFRLVPYVWWTAAIWGIEVNIVSEAASRRNGSVPTVGFFLGIASLMASSSGSGLSPASRIHPDLSWPKQIM